VVLDLLQQVLRIVQLTPDAEAFQRLSGVMR